MADGTALSPKAVELVVQSVMKHLGGRESVKLLHKAYDAHFGSAPGKSPEALRQSFQDNGYLSLSEVTELVRWKLGRLHVGKFVDENADSSVRGTTCELVQRIEVVSPENALEIARRLSQIGVAAGSALLATWSADSPIIDTRAWNSLYVASDDEYFAATSDDKPNQQFKPGNYENYVCIVRLAAKEFEVTARCLKIGLYMTGKLNGR